MSHTLSQDSHMRFTRDVKVFIPHLWTKDNVYSWWQSRCGDSWPAARQDIFKKWKISVTAEFCHKHKMYKQLKNQSDKHSHCLSTMEVEEDLAAIASFSISVILSHLKSTCRLKSVARKLLSRVSVMWRINRRRHLSKQHIMKWTACFAFGSYLFAEPLFIITSRKADGNCPQCAAKLQSVQWKHTLGFDSGFRTCVHVSRHSVKTNPRGL